MHVFLTGATGFIGSYMLQELVDRGHTARCLVRHLDDRLRFDTDELKAKGVEKVKGDITSPKSLNGLMRGCDAVIHLVGIIEEKPAQGITFEALHYQGAAHVVDEARESGIDRFIQMSANGARQNGVSAYQTTKWKAEEYVRNAGFEHWTIFRPSTVFGKPAPGQPEFATQLVQSLIKPFPILPVFGDGNYEMQPVAIEDLATAFVQALERDAAAQQTYCAAGPAAYTYNEILDIISEGAGIDPKPKINQPIWLVRPVVNTAGRLGLLPITPDQFEMLIEGNTCDPSLFFKDFDLQRIPFTPENLRYLR